ncbi:MAG: DUF3151 family protein [Nitriliruptoraceae bacterium]
MSDRHETLLSPAPDGVSASLARALEEDRADRKSAVAAVVAAHPTFLDGWATLAKMSDDPIERYAYARVGYHRGLDALRAAGWGGRGYVRWSQPENRSLLRCLARLRDAAADIGEDDEVARLDEFLRDLDPDWDDANVPD